MKLLHKMVEFFGGELVDFLELPSRQRWKSSTTASRRADPGRAGQATGSGAVGGVGLGAR
ncbi:transcriptional regulator, XRE family [Mycobacterium xenopi 4042]|uniref:Transcriptional regulator, XRE family n=1 Tax=Mycobacterium xenopi 4042 TaxID=1299334 RepID=X8AKY7_MYCXE|nr:transcriptional regulator, XRE family [Mycobacterium xenopi 4042]